MVMAPDSRTDLLSMDGSGSIVRWNLETQQLLQQSEPVQRTRPDTYGELHALTDGRLLLDDWEKLVPLDSRTLTIAAQPERADGFRPARCLALSEDGRLSVSDIAEHGPVELRDQQQGKVLRQLSPGGVTDDVNDAVFTKDGTRIVLCRDARLELVDVTSGALLHTLELPPAVLSAGMSMSDDGRILGAGHATVLLSEPPTVIADRRGPGGATILSAKGHLRFVHGEHSVHLVETASGREVAKAPMSSQSSCVVRVGSTPRFAMGLSSGQILIWDVRELLRANRQRVAGLSESELWSKLVDMDPAVGYGAAIELSEQKDFRKALRTPPPIVGGAKATPANQVQRLMAQLRHKDATRRDAAEQELIAMGHDALPFLDRALSTSNVELRERLHAIREEIGEPPLTPPPPIRISLEQLRAARLIEVLSWSNTGDFAREIEQLERVFHGNAKKR